MPLSSFFMAHHTLRAVSFGDCEVEVTGMSERVNNKFMGVVDPPILRLLSPCLT